MSKRANSEGCIRERSDGRWEGMYTCGRNPNGTLIRRSVYGATQDEVRVKLRDITKKLDEGLYIKPDKMTVEAWLRTWFDVYFKPNHRASTATVYDCNINTYLIPSMGRMQLQKLRVEQVQTFVNKQAKGKQPATVRKIMEVFKAALKQAVVNGLVAKNPCDGVTLPKLEQKEVEFLEPDEQKKLLVALPDTDNGRALSFILKTGLRVSELCALRWSDVEADHFTVRQGAVRTKVFDAKEGELRTTLTIAPPKSKAGKREIPIVAAVPSILQEQRKLYAERRLAAGELWQDGGFVFSSETGAPKDPSNLRRALSSSLKKAGLKHRGVHALRHTFATNLIRAGADARTVGELIGHSKVAFTLQTYVHSDMGTKKRALEAMQKGIF